MKIQSLITASLLAGIGLWAGSARAQVGGVRASVPFPFTVSGKTFAPGEYTLEPSKGYIAGRWQDHSHGAGKRCLGSLGGC